MSDNKKFEDAIVKLDFLRSDENNFKDAVSKLNDKLNNSDKSAEATKFAKDQKSK